MHKNPNFKDSKNMSMPSNVVQLRSSPTISTNLDSTPTEIEPIKAWVLSWSYLEIADFYVVIGTKKDAQDKAKELYKDLFGPGDEIYDDFVVGPYEFSIAIKS